MIVILYRGFYLVVSDYCYWRELSIKIYLVFMFVFEILYIDKVIWVRFKFLWSYIVKIRMNILNIINFVVFGNNLFKWFLVKIFI